MSPAQTLFALISLVSPIAAFAQPSAALQSADCPALRVDLTAALPELIEPQKLEKPTIRIDAPTGARLERARREDPNGLCYYRDANRALPPPTKGRVVFIGDSVTEYWQRANPAFFTGDVINRGISGQDTAQMLARFRYDVLDLKPRIVHILAGINDPMGASGTMLTASNIASMVELAQAHKIQVVLGLVTPAETFWLEPGIKLGPEIAALNNWLRNYARKAHIHVVDYYSPLAGTGFAIRPDLSNDGLHPNRNGYALMTPLARAALGKGSSQP